MDADIAPTPPSEQTSLPLAPIEVAVEGAHGGDHGVLTYGLPARWRGRIDVGSLIWAPLRKRLALGVVVGAPDEPRPFALRPIHAPVEPAFRLEADQLATGDWLAREYATSLFAALAPFLPPGVTYRAVEHLRLAEGVIPDAADVTPAQRRLLNLLDERGEVSLEAARAALGTKLTTVVPRLDERGLIERIARVTHHLPQERGVRFVRLVSRDPEQVTRAPRQRAVLDYLAQRARLTPSDGDRLIRLDDVLVRTGTDASVVGALARKGAVDLVVLPRPGAGPPSPPKPAPMLTPPQAAAWTEIERALTRRDPTPFLLHGVTGSGKTEVYLRAVAWCLRHGRSAIVLVPEIGLAAQVVGRFRGRFPDKVAVLHSALTDAERYRSWQTVAAGEHPVVVGPRSALFAPVRDLGLIVLDEEHEGAYKQDAEPRYHARALAERLAAQHGAVLILGSATPAVETAWRAEPASGQIRRLELPSRVGPDLGERAGFGERAGLALPDVDVVDMRLELGRGNTSLFSERLQELLARTLAAREQAILFLNRRGLATIVLCRGCGLALRCPFCDIPLVYHRDRDRLICHRCNHREVAIRSCPVCAGGLDYFGAGTQRVEEEVRRLLPGARVLRWDQDSVKRAGGHDRLLRRVEGREVDIVVGTQMIAKGLDLPLVTAVGVIHADTMLHLPDFRAGERTFQLLTQVAGRAGRRAPGSRVVVQSYTPEHYAIQAASRHDYAAFYAEEIDFRRVHRYPPFTRLVRYLFRDADESRCAAEGDDLARLLARHIRARNAHGRTDLLGPTPAFASRVRGKYQWQVILRTDDLPPLLDGLPVRPGWSVDVDPQSLL